MKRKYLLDLKKLTSTNTLFSSIRATFLPKQTDIFHSRRPVLNSTLSSEFLLHHLQANAKDEIHLHLHPKPSHSALRRMLTTPGGASFRKSPVTGGKIRRPSFITSWRYGRLRASASVVGFDTVAWDISLISIACTCALVTIYKRVARIACADVSDPTILWLKSVTHYRTSIGIRSLTKAWARFE